MTNGLIVALTLYHCLNVALNHESLSNCSLNPD